MRIFSQNATKREEVADSDYKKGAASLGKDPLNTTRWYFNSLLRTADLKKSEIDEKVQAAESKGKLETTEESEQKLNDAASVKISSLDISEQKKAESDNESATSENTKNAETLATTANGMKNTVADINNTLKDFNEDYTAEIAEINKKKQKLQSLLSSIGGDKIQGYLYDDMDVLAGASYSLIGISPRFKLYCNQSGNTGTMNTGSFNPSDGATITIGTAKFTAYIESLGLPLKGKISILGNPFEVNDEGFLIDPLTGTALTHRKIAAHSDDFYLRCVGGLVYTAQYESGTPLYESFDSKNYSFSYIGAHSHDFSFTTDENNETTNPSVHSHNVFAARNEVGNKGRAAGLGYASNHKSITHSSSETYNGIMTYFASSSETLKNIDSGAGDTLPKEIQTKTMTTSESGAHNHSIGAQRTKNPTNGVDSFYMIDYIKPKSINLLVVEYV